MKYMMKSGTLYKESSQIPLAQIKSSLLGAEKQIYKMGNENAFRVNIRYLNQEKSYTGDVRNKEYILSDPLGNIAVSAFSRYAVEDDPDVMGWPICKVPRVDRAMITANKTAFVLRMHNNQNYALTNADGADVLWLMHNGIIGGWMLEDSYGFSVDVLCAIFVFCRYIEQENEFLVV